MNTILSKVLGGLNSIRLNLTEWLAVTAALTIAGLVAALRLQGSQLHKAQIALLAQNLQSKEDRAHADTEAAHKAYSTAFSAFVKAGGKFVLFLALALPHPARSNPPQPYDQCVSTLSACDKLTKAQDAQVNVLQQSVKAWKTEAEKRNHADAPVLLVGTASGVLAGIVTGEVLDSRKGVAVGGTIGGLVGFCVGLLINGVK